MTFNQIQIGDSFYSSGTLFIKKSSRTAYIFGMPHRWFYFSNTDPIYKTKKLSDQHTTIFYY